MWNVYNASNVSHVLCGCWFRIDTWIMPFEKAADVGPSNLTLSLPSLLTLSLYIEYSSFSIWTCPLLQTGMLVTAQKQCDKQCRSRWAAWNCEIVFFLFFFFFLFCLQGWRVTTSQSICGGNAFFFGVTYHACSAKRFELFTVIRKTKCFNVLE